MSKNMRNLLKTIGIVVIPGAVPVAAASMAYAWVMEKRNKNNTL